MSKSLRYTFLVHALVALILGLPLLVAPGRWLNLFGWAPIDPIMSRFLGAALLAMAWSSYRGWQAQEWKQVQFLVELEAIFCVLSAIGLLRHLLGSTWPLMVWLVLALAVSFAVAWSIALAGHRRAIVQGDL